MQSKVACCLSNVQSHPLYFCKNICLSDSTQQLVICHLGLLESLAFAEGFPAAKGRLEPETSLKFQNLRRVLGLLCGLGLRGPWRRHTLACGMSEAW